VRAASGEGDLIAIGGSSSLRGLRCATRGIARHTRMQSCKQTDNYEQHLLTRIGTKRREETPTKISASLEHNPGSIPLLGVQSFSTGGTTRVVFWITVYWY
jgi:hypothetical protein